MNINPKFRPSLPEEQPNIQHLITPGNHMPYFHWHSHMEILLIYRGRYRLENEKEQFSGTCPLVIVHFPYTFHSLNADPDVLYERQIIRFDPHILSQLSGEIIDPRPLQGASFLFSKPDPADMQALTEIIDLLHTYTQDTSMYTLLLCLLMRRILMICEAGRGQICRSQTSYIQEVLAWLAEHLAEPESAAGIAARFNVCPAKFHRDFKSALGKSYKKYLTDLRMHTAYKLLSEDAAIVDAAIETGYSSEAHFIKVFREYWGITPGRYLATREILHHRETE
ncbi:MAG: helix-turn-helix transcriptional regulator [Clostridia bacterium]|nr:helix-turn-helix transcriptional regulator [Clostridia bacterium]